MRSIFYCLVISAIFLIGACTVDQESHVVVFQGERSEHKWEIKDLNPDLPADWESFEYLTFEYRTNSTQRFNLKLYDSEGLRRLVLYPYQDIWVRASIPLSTVQVRPTHGHDMASINKIPMPGLCVHFTSNVGSINNIESLGVEMIRPMNSPTLELKNIRLTMQAEDSILSPMPLIDEFGQWMPGDWPGKAKSLDDLKAAWDLEERELKSGRFNVSKYGGYLESRTKATGFFRAEKIDGIWWFVDPEGYLFISLGSCGTGPGGSFARVEGREAMFAQLVPEEITSRTERIGSASFYSYNLYRRFGDNWYEKWMDFTVRRLEDWGMNTLANWSDNTLGRSGRVPYVATLRGWDLDPYYMGMPDVYDPDWAPNVDAEAKRQCAPLRNDPYLLGYFVANEPPWPGREQELARVILEGPDTPMKNALKNYLSRGDTPERRKAFVFDTYNIFITTVNQAIKRHDPNHLNLGLRFGGNPPEDIIKASSNIGFDVFSVNIYGHSINHTLLDRIDEFTGLPIIIGEYHFGTTGRGLSPGLAQAINQEERGAAYRYYVENAAAHPNMIGFHWFQWWDQPATGRFDGESYNIGLVDVADRPYKELLDAARETHGRLFQVHSGKISPVSTRAIIQ